MKAFRIIFLTFSVYFVFPFQYTLSQEKPAVAKQYLAKGDSLLARGEIRAAKKAFKKALRFDNTLVTARSGLGQVAMAGENWKEGAKQFGRILNAQPDDFEAHYYRGICYRESGKNAGIIFRRSRWRKAEKHFLRVFAQDSLYRDALYQLALLRKEQDNYPEAITLARQQVRLRPELVAPYVGLFRLYRAFLRNHVQAEKWLAHQPWREAQFFLGEASLARNQLAKADSIFDNLLHVAPFLPGQVSRTALFLDLAKLDYRRFNAQEAEKYFWQAVDSIKNDVDAALVFEEVKYIVAEEELETYRNLATLSEKRDFFRAFWQQRNPDPDAAFNARLAEHYRRLRHAEKYYAFDGFRTGYNNPDFLRYFSFPKTYHLNRKFNDKGLIYLRHGPPDEFEIDLEQQAFSEPVVDVWRYHENANTPLAPLKGGTSNMVFYFVADKYAGVNNWRFAPFGYRPVLANTLSDWHYGYYRLATEDIPGQQFSRELELSEESAEYVAIGLATDRHTDADFDVYFLLARADSLFNALDLIEAKKLYEKALKIYKDLVPAYLGLGKIAAVYENWREARGQFEKVLARDPRNLDAHYGLGICLRELGAYKTTLFNMREKEWAKAEVHFNRVFERDSLFKDVVTQYAKLEMHREHYDRAFSLARTEIRLRPDLPEAHLGLFRLYRTFIHEAQKDSIRTIIARSNDEYAQYFLGERFRLDGQLAQADSVCQRLLSESTALPKQPVLLSLAKIYAQKDWDESATEVYWRAVDDIMSHVDAAFVFEDLKYLVSDRELKAWRLLETTEQKQRFFRQFWAKRDPTPGARYNVRLAGHYRRLIRAEKDYAYHGLRIPIGQVTEFWLLKFPIAYFMNKEFNDPGLIYLRHGEPDEQTTTVSASPPNMTWSYHAGATTPEIIIHFFQYPPGNNWRFAAALEPEMLKDREHLDPALFLAKIEQNPGRQFSLLNEIGERSQEMVAIGLATDRHRLDRDTKPVAMPAYIATFRGERGKTAIEVYYGLPIYEISPEASGPETDSTIVVENGLAVHDLAWNEMATQTREMLIPPGAYKAEKDELFLDQLQVSLPPDSYYVSLHARPQKARLLSSSRFSIAAPNYRRPQLALSDLVLAFDIAPATQESKFIKNGLQITPNPTRTFASDKSVFVYFEVYHLEQDIGGKTAFEIEYTVSDTEGKKLFGLLSGDKKSSLALRASRQGDTPFSPEFIALDVSNLSKGEYKLIVQVTDGVSGEVVRKEREFWVY